MKPTAVLPRRISLRARLTLVYTAVFLAAGMVLLVVTYGLFKQELESSVLLSSPGGATAGQNTPGASLSPPAEPEPAPRGSAAPPAEGDTDAASTPDPPDGAAQEWGAIQRARVDDAAVTSLITQGAVALVLVGIAAAALGWLAAGRMLAPLRQVTDTTRRIAAAPAADRGLHERIALRGPDDEVKDLADNFDTMVERLDRSFDGQRRFVANASHELRTPLTLGRALIEMAMHRRSAPAEVQQLGADLLEVNDRHERLITGLLLLAASENELVERYPVDLADVAEHVVGQTEQEARQAGVSVRREAAQAPTTGDATLLERLVHNLVENGVRHNAAPDEDAGNAGDDAAGQGWVAVVTRTRDDGPAEVTVSNSGPVVPPYEVPLLFEPFRRPGADRLVTAKGAGLGLSIVRSIADAHGGEVAAHPREGGGLSVTVTLPAYRYETSGERAADV
ncbi:sensor histidine kinase [Streptomonospora salina]|uniref:histidine kinase n=1 Tax=Streptomonospora salina TaxID=104205 RepID=A0A841E4Q6_9ACTN|nr:HAMP domain-containing sensor histidine kinase [Streptomonospora salina]MBB5997752.1 signal transduction histidine kinase [Streptomonospora salina]